MLAIFGSSARRSQTLFLFKYWRRSVSYFRLPPWPAGRRCGILEFRCGEESEMGGLAGASQIENERITVHTQRPGKTRHAGS